MLDDRGTDWRLEAETLAERLRALRRDRNLTQEAVANHLGIRPQTWASYETGRTSMPAHFLFPLCELFDVPAQFLLRPPGSDDVWLLDQAHVDSLMRETDPESPRWAHIFAFCIDNGIRVVELSQVERLKGYLSDKRRKLGTRRHDSSVD